MTTRRHADSSSRWATCSSPTARTPGPSSDDGCGCCPAKPTNLTAIGHSYGSSTLAQALAAGAGDDVDAGVLLAAGFDLTQLLVGDLQLVVAPPVDLAALEEACVTAYAAGLAAEGCPVPLAVVRRQHAVAMVLYAAISAVPFEQLGAPPDVLEPLCHLRADLARHSLDLLDATAR